MLATRFITHPLPDGQGGVTNGHPLLVRVPVLLRVEDLTHVV